MDAGVVDLWLFGTACELLFGKCVSSAATATVWRISEASGDPTASGVPERICALVPSSATTSADLCRAAVCASAVSRHAAPHAIAVGTSRYSADPRNNHDCVPAASALERPSNSK